MYTRGGVVCVLKSSMCWQKIQLDARTISFHLYVSGYCEINAALGIRRQALILAFPLTSSGSQVTHLTIADFNYLMNNEKI